MGNILVCDVNSLSSTLTTPVSKHINPTQLLSPGRMSGCHGQIKSESPTSLISRAETLPTEHGTEETKGDGGGDALRWHLQSKPLSPSSLLHFTGDSIPEAEECCRCVREIM